MHARTHAGAGALALAFTNKHTAVRAQQGRVDARKETGGSPLERAGRREGRGGKWMAEVSREEAK
eukprot:4061521-Pleurochrysis_carterae.AAC.1